MFFIRLNCFEIKQKVQLYYLQTASIMLEQTPINSLHAD